MEELYQLRGDRYRQYIDSLATVLSYKVRVWRQPSRQQLRGILCRCIFFFLCKCIIYIFGTGFAKALPAVHPLYGQHQPGRWRRLRPLSPARLNYRSDVLAYQPFNWLHAIKVLDISPMKISLIVPVYNEQNTLGNFYRSVRHEPLLQGTGLVRRARPRQRRCSHTYRLTPRKAGYQGPTGHSNFFPRCAMYWALTSSYWPRCFPERLELQTFHRSMKNRHCKSCG
jgi:hypothetical protein